MYRRAKYEARVAFNKNEIAGIELAIGHALQKGCTETNMMKFIRQEYPRFHFSTNGLLDLYRNAVRFRSEEKADSFFIGVYSSGADGVWETRDDIKRESIFHKTRQE